MSFAALLDSTVNVARETPGALTATGGYGAPTETVLYMGVPCRFEALTKKLEIMAYDKQAVFPDYFVYMEFRSGVREGDLLIKNGRRFAVKFVEDWSEQGKYLKLAVSEIKRGE